MDAKIFEVSEKYTQMASDRSVGVVVFRGVGKVAANRRILEAKQFAMKNVERDRVMISERIRQYDAYFSANGYACPLVRQFERTMAEGIPRLNRFVETMLIAEMSTGVLMGAQDFDQMRGALLFDLANGADRYEGMRRQIIDCRADGTVVRDSEGIVASLFEGSDFRTRITNQTSTAIFFAFGAPRAPKSDVEGALDRLADILGPCSGEAMRQVFG